MSSPTLPYLKRRVDSDYEQISRALVARSVGFLLGSLGAGIVGSKWRRLSDFWIALSLFVAGGATIAAPWCQNLATLAAMFFLDGAAKGLLAVGKLFITNKPSQCTKGLVTNYGEGGLQNGGACEVLPLRKGGTQKVLAMLKGVHKRFWGSFYTVA